MFSSDMQEIEMEIEVARENIRLGELVTKLESNEDFKELITIGYFKNDAARVVMLKADKEFQSDEKQKKLDYDIMGISVFGEYLRSKKLLGAMSAEAMKEHEQTREELIGESI